MTESNTAAAKRGISGSTLKLIAVFTMAADHIGAFYLERILWQSAQASGVTAWNYPQLFSACPGLTILYAVLRLTGRIAFPIFCFLLVEGFLHTRSLPRYLMRLFVFALISEIPFDLAFRHKYFYPDYQNVFFTLLFGMLALTLIRYAKEHLPARSVSCYAAVFLAVFAAAAAAQLLHTDYDAMGVLTIVCMYYFEGKPVKQMLSGCCILTCMSLLEITSFLAVPLANAYNNTRGRQMKYFFYAFYPVHLYLLYLLSVCLNAG